MPEGRRLVVRAQDYYTPPPRMPADAWTLLPPAERVIAWYENKQQRRLPRPDGLLLGQRLFARIDAGRWVAECLCRSAQVVTPDDPRMYCVECLTGWYALTFPDDVAGVEASTEDRLPHERFWWAPGDDAWNRPQPQPVPGPKVEQPRPDPYTEGAG